MTGNLSLLEQFGKPIFVDVQYDTGNIDPWKVEDKITKRTKAIMCVHHGGMEKWLERL